MTLALADGRVLAADQVVLAIGNFPPSDPPARGDGFYRSLRYARDPWSPDALEGDRREDVLLLGTGLTMCDVALALRDLDHRGRIHAVSRRGLLPQPHRVSAAPPPHLDAPADLAEWPDSALGMLRAMRREVRGKAADAVDWREVVTSIRDDTPALWRRLAPRSAAGSASAAAVLGDASPPLLARDGVRRRDVDRRRGARGDRRPGGRLRRGRGRGRRHDLPAREQSDRGAPRREGDQLHRPGHRPRPGRRPACPVAPRRGLVRPDELGLGLDTDDDGRLLDRDGRASRQLFLVGRRRTAGPL